MIKILFVCHGNICRSPMAEFVFKDMLKQRGAEDKCEVASAAVSTEELGNPVYPPARRTLESHGLSCKGKYSVQVKKSDYTYYDYIICADSSNRRGLERIFGGDTSGKISLLLDYTDTPGTDISDPWYSGNFSETWDDIVGGCEGLIKFLGV